MVRVSLIALTDAGLRVVGAAVAQVEAGFVAEALSLVGGRRHARSLRPALVVATQAAAALLTSGVDGRHQHAQRQYYSRISFHLIV